MRRQRPPAATRKGTSSFASFDSPLEFTLQRVSQFPILTTEFSNDKDPHDTLKRKVQRFSAGFPVPRGQGAIFPEAAANGFIVAEQQRSNQGPGAGCRGGTWSFGKNGDSTLVQAQSAATYPVAIASDVAGLLFSRGYPLFRRSRYGHGNQRLVEALGGRVRLRPFPARRLVGRVWAMPILAVRPGRLGSDPRMSGLAAYLVR